MKGAQAVLMAVTGWRETKEGKRVEESRNPLNRGALLPEVEMIRKRKMRNNQVLVEIFYTQVITTSC